MVMTSIHNLLLSVAALSSTPTPITLDRSLLNVNVNVKTVVKSRLSFETVYVMRRSNRICLDLLFVWPLPLQTFSISRALCLAAKMVDLGQFSTPSTATIAPSPPPFLPSVCLPRGGGPTYLIFVIFFTLTHFQA